MDATIDNLLISLLQCKVSAVKQFAAQLDTLQVGDEVSFRVVSEFHSLEVKIKL